MFRRMAHAFDYLFRRRRLEEDLDEELRASIEILADRYAARGMEPGEARRRARMEFEGVEQVKERVRDGLRGSAISSLLQDARYAWRGLRRRRSFTVVALMTLALGIGVTTAVFSVVYAVLLRPLPYNHPEQLVLVWTTFRNAGTGRAPMSGPMLAEIARRNRALAGVAAIWVGTGIFQGDNPEQVKVANVTSNFFDLLGVGAVQGRTFTGEERAGRRAVVLLTDGFFRRRFAGDRGRIGQGVRLNGGGTTLVGVLPPDFQLQFAPDANVPADVQAFTPFPFDLKREPRKLYYLRVVARLKPGVSIHEAQQDLDRVAREIRSAWVDFEAEKLQFTVTGMQADSVRDIRTAMGTLFAGAGFVLLICCVNVASLLMARVSDRRREIALRLALGASRGRILRQLLAESGVLCLLGGAAGVVVGWAGFRALQAIRPERLARMGGGDLSWPVLGFTAAVTLAAAALFGVVPALESYRTSLMEALRRGGRGWLGRLDRRSGGALVIGEIALGFVLVTGAALAARTLARIEQVNPGFEPNRLLTFQLAFGNTLNPDIKLSTIREWDAMLAALPGVERAGATSHLPLDDFPNWYSPYRAQATDGSVERNRSADYRSVTPGYLEAMGVRLIEGRYFDEQDRAGGRPVVIVDELLARTAWPGESAIGKRIDAEHVVAGGFRPIESVVVGVVEHVRNHSLTRQVRGEIYIPFEQSPRSPLTFALRTRVDPAALVPAVRAALHGSDPGLAMAKVRTMNEYVARDIAPAGFTAVLAAVFGVLALVLAATGVYGVLNYQVSRRLPEIGVRMAFGAQRSDVLRLILRQVLALAGIGVLVGTAAALAAARWIGTLVYGVSARDPLSYSAALLLVPAAALAGCWFPAWRAASADSAATIREE